MPHHERVNRDQGIRCGEDIIGLIVLDLVGVDSISRRQSHREPRGTPVAHRSAHSGVRPLEISPLSSRTLNSDRPIAKSRPSASFDGPGDTLVRFPWTSVPENPPMHPAAIGQYILRSSTQIATIEAFGYLRGSDPRPSIDNQIGIGSSIGTQQNNAPSGITKVRYSEIEPQRKLARAIASRPLGQRGLQNPERGTGDIHCRRRKIGVVQTICERSFEADVVPLPKVEALGETHVHVEHVWALQDTHTAAPKPSSVVRGQSEGTRVVELLRSLP